MTLFSQDTHPQIHLCGYTTQQLILMEPLVAVTLLPTGVASLQHRSRGILRARPVVDTITAGGATPASQRDTWIITVSTSSRSFSLSSPLTMNLSVCAADL